VVVVNIHFKILKIEEEKIFMSTVIGHELIGPKNQSNFLILNTSTGLFLKFNN